MSKGTFRWTTELDNELAELLYSGHTHVQIATILSQKHGREFTKSAIGTRAAYTSTKEAIRALGPCRNCGRDGTACVCYTTARTKSRDSVAIRAEQALDIAVRLVDLRKERESIDRELLILISKHKKLIEESFFLTEGVEHE